MHDVDKPVDLVRLLVAEVSRLRAALHTAEVVRDDARRVAQVRLDEKRELEAEVGRLRELVNNAACMLEANTDKSSRRLLARSLRDGTVVPPREDAGHG